MKLQLVNLTRRFGALTAVDHLNLTVGNGVYGLLGVNGAGKTTLMRMICTLIRPTEGQILCDGRDIFEMEGEYRKLLGYLPQDFGFYPDFTVAEYLRYIAAIKGLRPAVAKRRIKELLPQVGLQRAANKKIKTLSGGMKRRAGIAQAMLNDPRILILDEPTAGLDPTERMRFRNLISQLGQDRIIILSTHIVSDLEYIAGWIWLMKDGQFAAQGTVADILGTMPEPVWICRGNQRTARQIVSRYKVSNLRSEGDAVVLRVISPQAPMENALRVEPNLEDVFLYYFGERGGEHGIPEV